VTVHDREDASMKKFLLVVAAAAGAAAGVAIWKRRTQPVSLESNVGSWAESVNAAASVEVAKPVEVPVEVPVAEPAEVPVEEAAVKKPRRKKPLAMPDAEG
jgi:hypothetical protein